LDQTCIQKKDYWTLSFPSPGAANNSNPKAREKNKQTMAYSRFASLDENDLSKLLADKDSDSTKKATKGCKANF
jgi:hypothetical protein